MALPTILCHVHNQYNSFHPVRHKRFEYITSLLKQASDVFFGNTDLVALTETWKLPTALFQLLFVANQ